MALFTIAVEGPQDEAVVRRTCQLLGHQVVTPYLTGGKSKLDKRITGYNNAARFSPWIVLRDLDRDAECAATLVRNLLPEPVDSMLFRVPVRAVESWLLADRGNLAAYLGIRPADVPEAPETILQPKRALVDAARRSKWQRIQRDMVPREGAGVQVGPGYTARVIEFVNDRWDPEVASHAADSLRRFMLALSRW